MSQKQGVVARLHYQIKEQQPQLLLLHATETGYIAFGPDAVAVGKLNGLGTIETPDDMGFEPHHPTTFLSHERYRDVVRSLIDADYQVGIVPSDIMTTGVVIGISKKDIDNG